jgi:hypothetical protein
MLFNMDSILATNLRFQQLLCSGCIVRVVQTLRESLNREALLRGADWSRKSGR